MKRIICCTDGTWIKQGARDRGTVVQTNVEKIFNSIGKTGGDNIQQLKACEHGAGLRS